MNQQSSNINNSELFKQPSIYEKIVNPKTILKIVSVIAIFLIWFLVTKFGIYRFYLIPEPQHVLVRAFNWIQTDTFWIDTYRTLLRVFGGFFAACLIAIPLGLMIGWNKIFSDFTYPALEVLRPIPGIAYIPLAILIFPWSELSIAFICFIGAFFPILLNSITGVTLIDRDYFRAAKCLGSNNWQIFWNIVVPGSLPFVTTGAALGMGISWMACVPAEMIEGSWGLGYRIWESYTLMRFELIIVGMIAIGFFGLTSSVLIRFVTMKIIPWRKSATESLDEEVTQ